MNNCELGESESASKRIDTGNGERDEAREKTCANGLRTVEGNEWVKDGQNVVGGS